MSHHKIAVLTTHPIQYQAPWFRALAAHPDLDLQVFFCHQATSDEQAVAGFGVKFDWDVPLLDGYQFKFLKNIASKPTANEYGGLDTPVIKEIIEKEKFDAVIVNGWHYKSAWQAIRACWRTKTPVMARGDSHLRTPRGPLKRILKWPSYRWFIPKFDACLAVGKWSREYYLHYGARPERIFLVPHVINEAFFISESVSLNGARSGLRERWELRQDSVVFLFSAKFIDKKRPLDFVKAIELAARKGINVMGLMVGDGPLRAGCESYVREKNIPVRFTGFLNQSQIVDSYLAADALVLPSDGGETWGLVVNEAMACGRPCFVSDHVGSGPDMIVPGETGDIFPLAQVDALADMLASYSSRPVHLNEMGRLAQQRARKYSVGAAVDGVLRAVETVKAKRWN